MPMLISYSILNYIETFLLNPPDQAENLKHTLIGLLVFFGSPEEIIEKAKSLYEKETYNSTRKKNIIKNIRFLLEQFIFINTPYELSSFFFEKKNALSRFKDFYKEVDAFQKQLEKSKNIAETLQKMILTPSLGSLSLDKFIKEDLKGKVGKDIVIAHAEKLAEDFRSCSALLLLKIKPSDLSKYKGNDEDETVLSQSMRESQKIFNIIVYDLLWHASSFSHLTNIARFYLEVLKISLRKHDYHSAMAIFLALSNTGYKFESLKEIDVELEALSHKLSLNRPLALHNKLKELPPSCSIIPYLGVYITDATRINEVAGLDLYKKETEKFCAIGKLCEEIKFYQRNLSKSMDWKPLYYGVLQRTSQDDPKIIYQRRRQLNEEWTALSEANKKRARQGETYPVGSKEKLQSMLKDFLSLKCTQPLSEDLVTDHYLPYSHNSERSIHWKEKEKKPRALLYFRK